MQAIFKLYREGFSQSVEVGELFDYKDEGYVLTHILEMKRLYSKSSRIEVEGIAQKIGSQSDYSKYEPVSVFERKYIKCEFTNENPLYRVGDPFVYKGVCGQIECIESIRYEFVDMVIKYHARLFRPWSKAEMDQAVKNYRMSKFKVIG
ncbi:hypothetical protein [Enterococcus sp. AZ163]|uniref:hypothetical protein n=1 Tax=Enterococcus sp. AZ163 TaxID=2774638 RepID=UPI003D2E13A8